MSAYLDRLTRASGVVRGFHLSVHVGLRGDPLAASDGSQLVRLMHPLSGELACLLNQGAAAQPVTNRCCYGLLDLSHDVLLNRRPAAPDLTRRVRVGRGLRLEPLSAAPKVVKAIALGIQAVAATKYRRRSVCTITARREGRHARAGKAKVQDRIEIHHEVQHGEPSEGAPPSLDCGPPRIPTAPARQPSPPQAQFAGRYRRDRGGCDWPSNESSRA